MITAVSRSVFLRPHRRPLSPTNQTASFESQMIPTTPEVLRRTLNVSSFCCHRKLFPQNRNAAYSSILRGSCRGLACGNRAHIEPVHLKGTLQQYLDIVRSNLDDIAPPSGFWRECQSKDQSAMCRFESCQRRRRRSLLPWRRRLAS
jgi:hypothetical protein